MRKNELKKLPYGEATFWTLEAGDWELIVYPPPKKNEFFHKSCEDKYVDYWMDCKARRSPVCDRCGEIFGSAGVSNDGTCFTLRERDESTLIPDFVSVWP